MATIITIGIVVGIIFEAVGIYFFISFLKAKKDGKKMFSEAVLGNAVLSVFLMIIGILFTVFFILNNKPEV